MLALFTFIVLGLTQASLTWAQPVPAEIKSLVGFIFTPDENSHLVPNGTCFFVGVPVPEREMAIVYAVTAKHVLEEKTDSFFKKVSIRVNTKDGRSRMLNIQLRSNGPQQNLFFHSDPTVDLAVIRVHLDDTKDDFKYLLGDFILTKTHISSLNVTEGSEVFFTGLFSNHIGQQKNNPIVRFGRIALLTDEKIKWDEGLMVELYLVESASSGGNSGSPVFLFLGPERIPGKIMLGKRLMKLAGIMKGTFGEAAPVRSINGTDQALVHHSTGIAAVVPAYKLEEILYRPEVKAERGF
jgi:hypothetical protein